MVNHFRWNGNSVRGPLHLLVESQVQLPRGPPESAPLNTGRCSLSMLKIGEGWSLQKLWTRDSVRVGDVCLNWQIEHPDHPREPAPITHLKDKIGEMLRRPSSFGCRSSMASSWNIDEHVAAGSEFEMTVDCPSLRDQLGQPDPEGAVAYTKLIMRSPNAQNVEFKFEGSEDSLWANATKLKEESPYFERLLRSELHETTSISQPRRTSTLIAFEDDCDDEPAIKLEANQSTRRDASGAHYTVTVSSPSIIVFEQVLLWMIHKEPFFECAVEPDSPDAEPPTKRSKKAAASPQPAVDKSPPASRVAWKSVYRLARLLEIRVLEALAIDEFASTLTTDDAARELFSPLSASHLDVRKVAMDFTIANWNEVKGTEGMKEVEKLMKEGKVEKGGEIWMELALKR